jgi:peptidoglycan/xylan/chitin deacetylase (PgdA/CDA1 family)
MRSPRLLGVGNDPTGGFMTTIPPTMLPLTAPAPLPRRVRDRLETATHWSGASTLFTAVHPAPGAMILMYHSVSWDSARDGLDPNSTIDVRLFDAQMRFLARRRRVVTVSRLVEQIEAGRPVPAGTVAITFDDGYRDLLDTALPILARHDLPATLYLATGYVERGENQWIDQLYWMFKHRTRNVLWTRQPVPRTWVLTRADQLRAAYRALHAPLLTALPQRRSTLLAEVAQQLRPRERPPRQTLTWPEVKTALMRHRKLEIGVHSREHLDLSSCPDQTARDEVSASVADVEQQLGLRPRALSYPYGRFSAAAAEQAARLGLRSAAVTTPAHPVRPGTDPYALPRLIPPAEMTLFRHRTSGAYPQLVDAVWNRARSWKRQVARWR